MYLYVYLMCVSILNAYVKIYRNGVKEIPESQQVEADRMYVTYIYSVYRVYSYSFMIITSCLYTYS